MVDSEGSSEGNRNVFLIERRGYSVFKTDNGCVVRQAAPPFWEILTSLPFAFIAIVVAGGSGSLACYLPISYARDPGQFDGPLWLAPLMAIILYLGTVLALWGLATWVTIAFPTKMTIDQSQGRTTFRASVLRFVYRRRILNEPLSVVIEIFSFRGDPTFRLLLQDEGKKRCPVTVPTTVGSQSTAKKNALDLAFPIAREIGAAVVIEARDSRGKRLPPEKVEIPAAP